MTLLFDGNRAFFEERTPRDVKNLWIKLPKDSVLICNGIRLTPEADTVHIHIGALYPGENVLILKKEDRR